jgi:hypothetical protein
MARATRWATSTSTTSSSPAKGGTSGCNKPRLDAWRDAIIKNGNRARVLLNKWNGIGINKLDTDIENLSNLTRNHFSSKLWSYFLLKKKTLILFLSSATFHYSLIMSNERTLIMNIKCDKTRSITSNEIARRMYWA